MDIGLIIQLQNKETTVEQYRRSVHREYCRPQGKRASPKQFSSVSEINAGGDILTAMEANTKKS